MVKMQTFKYKFEYRYICEVNYMGNVDGFLSAMANQGRNKVLGINKEWYFSFAFGNEIALCGDGNFFILNCGQGLWDEVNEFVAKSKDIKNIKKFWKEKSKEYEISTWSGDFEDL